MKKTLKDEYLEQVVREELETLDGIIDYAERMIRNGDLKYRKLKSNAYTKSLVVDREKGGATTFRLGMESIVYPKRDSGYATPHSPVGRLCSVADLGFDGYSEAWGEYQVTEERQFRRHQFEEIERHARNFLAMGVASANGKGKVMDLRAFLGRTLSGTKKLLEKPPENQHQPTTARNTNSPKHHTTEPSVQQEVNADESMSKHVSQQDAPILKIIDEDEFTSSASLEASDDFDDEDGGETPEKFSLDEHFFLNRTRIQDKIISRAPVGPMWVEGVAGSGKTSAALGRTKMLCDFNSNEISDRKTFHAILGDDFDYWEGAFAGKFSQEGSVGFVRTAELIQYLKETCSRLSMPSLPVLEYHELRSRLRAFRNLESSGFANTRFKHSSNPGDPATTTLAWLNAARSELGKIIAANIVAQASMVDSEELEKFAPQQQMLFSAARQKLQSEIEKTARELLAPLSSERTIYGLAKNLLATIEKTAQIIMGPDSLSMLVGSQLAYGKSIQELSKQLAGFSVDLFVNRERLLVLYHDGETSQGGPIIQPLNKPAHSSKLYTFLSDTGLPLTFSEALHASQNGFAVRAVVPSLPNAQGYETLFLPVSELFIRLATPKSLLYLDTESLKWVKVLKGIGSLPPPNADENNRVTPRKLFMQIAIELLAKPLRNFAGLYAQALKTGLNHFPNAHAARQVLDRLKEQRLNDSDIDLLLCLAHDLSVSVTTKLPSSLREPSYYQSVFVDEVQDFTEQQIYLMTSQADPTYSAITVVGDRSQQLLRNEPIQISKCFPIGKQPAFEMLEENLRQKSQPELARLSATLRQLFEQAGDTKTHAFESLLIRELKSGKSAFSLHEFDRREDEYEYLCDYVAAAPENQSLAVVLPDLESAQLLHAFCEDKLEGSFRKMSISEHIDLTKKYLVHFTSVLHIKGLEFDIVLLPMMEQYDLSQSIFRNRLYVGCTRARQRLVMSRTAQ